MNSTAADSSVHLSGIEISYGGNVAVHKADIDIESGEFFTLLGPSGCGKTTLLRTIAGFNRQSAGSIRIGGAVVDDVPAHRRDTGMVFQNYAIFPHLDVRANIAYGLRARKMSKAAREERVDEVLAMVDLERFGDRMPRDLSGGQQQRVVIARAIAIRPRVLLMDEPLANLDAKLRVRLRNDIRDLQRRLGITTIYVTHDQEEALDISDRIAVMSQGEVLQIDSPDRIYGDPQKLFVARFVGEGTFLHGRAGDDHAVTLPNGTRLNPRHRIAAGSAVAGIRPEQLRVCASGESADFEGDVVARSYLGPVVQLRVDVGLDVPLLVRLPADGQAKQYDRGDRIQLVVSVPEVLAFPGNAEGELATPIDEELEVVA